ncbi:MAG: hypothetical protein K5695_08415 [Oscillospiraceae bacterium]|nr:hypothetical protein [Oscillospiraceae bacterium]
MAFMGIVIAGLALFIIGGIFVVSLILLIIATVLLIKKHKTAAVILYIIGSIPAVLGAACVIWYVHSQRFPEFSDYSGGTVTLNMSDVDNMKQCIVRHDMSALDALLDKQPELIYYLDQNQTSLLEYGLSNCDIEIMQIAVDHGARFDDENAFGKLIYKCSLDDFFDFDYWGFAYTFETKPEPRFRDGETTDEIIAAAQFAIDHGAAVTWQHYDTTETFADSVRWWIEEDGVISDKDKELLSIAKKAVQE